MDVQTAAAPEKMTRKKVRKTVYEKLNAALADYEGLAGKKFESHLKKASKLLASDIRKALHNKANGEKKTKQKPVAVKVAKA